MNDRLRRALGTATRLVPASVALASVLLFLVTLTWAVLTPVGRAPDELDHLNSVVRVAQGGGWPRPYEAKIQDEIYDVSLLAARDAVYPPPPDVTVPSDTRRFFEVEPTPPAARSSLDALDDGKVYPRHDPTGLHPPAYYYAAAALYTVFDAGDRRYDRAVFLLRVFTALSIALTVPMACYVATRDVTGRKTLGEVAAFLPLLVPQLHFVGGGVQNDGFSIASGAVIWATSIAIMCSGPSRRRLVVLTVALGLACLTKATSLSLLPIVPVALAVAYRRSLGAPLRAWGRPWLAATAGVLTGAFVLGGWWWAVNLLRYGTLQPGGERLVPRAGEVLSPIEYLDVFVRRLRWTFFGEAGVKQPEAFAALTLTLAVLFLVLVTVGLLTRGRRPERLVMVFGGLLTTALLFNQAYSGHRATRALPAIQGRYLYVLLVPIVVLMTLGLVQLARLARVRAEWLLRGTAGVGLVVALTGVVLAFRQFYRGPGESLAEAVDRLLAWAAWPPPVLAALAASVVLAVVALAWHLARPADPAPAAPTPRELVRVD